MVIKASDIMTPAEIAAIPPGTIKTSCNHAPVQIPVIPRKAEVKIPVRDMSWEFGCWGRLRSRHQGTFLQE